MDAFVITWAMAAGRNFELRDECLSNARKAAGSQRKFFVDIAKRHQRLALENLASARSSLARLIREQQKEAA